MPEVGSLFVGLSLDTAQFDRQVVAVGNRAEDAGKKLDRGFRQGAQSVNLLTASSRQAQFAVTNLGFQINDVVTGLASGQKPAQVFAQQIGQILQLFTQGGGFSNVMRGAGTAIASMITPTRLLGVGLVGLAAGFTLVTARAMASQSAVRGFDVMLRGLGQGSQATASGLEAAAKRLRDVGLSTGEARDQLRAAARAGINPGQAERIVRTGQNLVPVLGEDAPQILTKAVSGGVETLAPLVRQLKLVSASEVEAAREAAKYGNELQYIERWFRLIEERSKGLNKEALSPFGAAMRELNLSWAEALDKLGNTAPIRGAIAALTDLGKVIKWISDLMNTGPLAGGIGGGVGGVIAGASLGRIFGPYGMAVGAILGGAAGAYYGAGAGAAGAGGPGAPSPATQVFKPAGTSIPLPSKGDPRNKENLIRYWASYFGHDPDTAVKVARAEGLGTYTGDKGTSFGAFQLHVGMPAMPVKGLGDEYKKETGRDPSDPANEDDMIRWSLANLGRTGWGPYHGAKRVGLGATQGVAAGGSILSSPEAKAEEWFAGRAAEFKRQQFATDLQISAERQITAGYRSGMPGGGRRAELRTQANLELDLAFGPGPYSPEQKALREEQAAKRRAQLMEADLARTERLFAEQDEADRLHSAQLGKQSELMGQSTEEIDRQVALLRVKQQAEAAGVKETSEAYKSRVAETNALHDQMKVLAQRQAMMRSIQEVAGVFESAFSKAFDSLADGTFKLREALQGLLKDLGKVIASQAFRAILYGDTGSGGGLVGNLFGAGGGKGGESGGGGILGSLLGKIIPAGLGIATGGAASATTATGIAGWSWSELGAELPGHATGGSFRVGGSGSIDSQIIGFRATPGEMIDVTPPGGHRGGGGEDVITINLNPSEGWVAGVADQRIMTASGQIIAVSVAQSSKNVARNFSSISREAQARSL